MKAREKAQEEEGRGREREGGGRKGEEAEACWPGLGGGAWWPLCRSLHPQGEALGGDRGGSGPTAAAAPWDPGPVSHSLTDPPSLAAPGV